MRHEKKNIEHQREKKEKRKKEKKNVNEEEFLSHLTSLAEKYEDGKKTKGKKLRKTRNEITKSSNEED